MDQLQLELPGDILRDFRMSLGYMSAQDWADALRAGTRRGRHVRGLVYAFAGDSGWDYYRLNRLERVRWGSDPKDWRGSFSHKDLERLVDAGWLAEGDEYYQRFEQAIKWQAQVLQHGPSVYEGARPALVGYAPIPAAYVTVLLRQVFSQLPSDVFPGTAISPEEWGALEKRIEENATYVLMLLQLQRPPSEDDEETTRGLLQIGTGSEASDTPLVRTLRFLYRYVKSEILGEIDDMAARRREAPLS